MMTMSFIWIQRLDSFLYFAKVEIYIIYLSFDIGWRCWLKKPLKVLDFSKNIVTNFLLIYNGGIDGIYWPLTKVLSTDQYVFNT